MNRMHQKKWEGNREGGTPQECLDRQPLMSVYQIQHQETISGFMGSTSPGIVRSEGRLPWRRKEETGWWDRNDQSMTSRCDRGMRLEIQKARLLIGGVSWRVGELMKPVRLTVLINSGEEGWRVSGWWSQSFLRLGAISSFASDFQEEQAEYL